MEELIKKTAQWFHDRNLVKGSTPEKQYLKLIQECGELSDSLCKGKDAKDDIGDITVVLIGMCEQLGYTLEECLQLAYNEIKDRKGKMIDGVFVKEEDLKKDNL